MTTPSTSDGDILDDAVARRQILKFANAGTATVSEVKTQWDKVVRRTRRKPTTITCNGKPKAVLVSPADYRRIAVLVEALIEKAEDAEDAAAILQRQNEKSVLFESADALNGDGI